MSSHHACNPTRAEQAPVETGPAANGARETIRLVVADRQALFCQLLAMAFRHGARVEVLAAARDADQAVRLAATFRPHVVLLDVRLDCRQGFAAARTIMVSPSESRVLFIDDQYCATNVWHVWQAGAWGYWTKQDSFEEVAEAVRRVAAGSLAFCSTAAAHLASAVCDGRHTKGRPRAAGKLSQRELDVLQCLAEGLTVRQCAARLRLSPHTVDYYKRRCMRKLQVHNKVDLVRLAVRQGLVGL